MDPWVWVLLAAAVLATVAIAVTSWLGWWGHDAVQPGEPPPDYEPPDAPTPTVPPDVDESPGTTEPPAI